MPQQLFFYFFFSKHCKIVVKSDRSSGAVVEHTVALATSSLLKPGFTKLPAVMRDSMLLYADLGLL